MIAFYAIMLGGAIMAMIGFLSARAEKKKRHARQNHEPKPAKR
jgi:hypothetical protein